MHMAWRSRRRRARNSSSKRRSSGVCAGLVVWEPLLPLPMLLPLAMLTIFGDTSMSATLAGGGDERTRGRWHWTKNNIHPLPQEREPQSPPFEKAVLAAVSCATGDARPRSDYATSPCTTRSRCTRRGGNGSIPEGRKAAVAVARHARARACTHGPVGVVRGTAKASAVEWRPSHVHTT